MEWQEVRENFPSKWVVIEALQSHSESDLRILDNIAVVNTFPDSLEAMRYYRSLHKQAPDKELYVLSTDRLKLDIKEVSRVGTLRRITTN